MTDTLLALIPTYGVWVVGIVVFIACFGVPLPASVMIMTAGGFAASGTMSLVPLLLINFAAIVIVDQITFAIGRFIGPGFLSWARQKPRYVTTLERIERLLERRGTIAVFLTKAVITPLGPYTGYVVGALRMPWWRYSLAAVLGAGVWTMAYTLAGYGFAGQISQLSSIATNGAGFAAAGAVALLAAWWLRRSWRAYQAEKNDRA